MSDAKIVKAVFDCNIFLQAASRETSVAAKCLRFVEDGLVRLFICEEILLEVEDVLNRPAIRNYFQSLSDEIVEAFLIRLRNHSELILQIPKKFDYPRDPDDEIYINLAVEAEASFIVSRDKDLLDLMTAYTSEAKEFRQRFRPLQVIEPLAFLMAIRSLENE